MRFSAALISILVLPSIALASPGAHVSSSMGAGATAEVEANSKDVALPHENHKSISDATTSLVQAAENIAQTAEQQNTETIAHAAAAAVSNAESSSNDKEKTSVDTASAAKKDTHGATTSANAETSVKLDTSGMNSILSTENPSLLRLMNLSLTGRLSSCLVGDQSPLHWRSMWTLS